MLQVTRAIVDADDIGTERGEWAGRITASWRQSVEAIIETGRLLAAAKHALPGEFEDMVEDDLPFGPRTARRLMAIAADKRLRTHGSAVLPPHWRTLYELSRLDDDTFADMVAEGTINGEMERQDITRFLIDRRDMSLAARSIKWPAGRYGLIYADPPWRFEPGGSPSRAVERHYPTMLLEDICALPVADIAADQAVLFLWSPSGMLPQAFQVIEAWGFNYRTQMVWIKNGIGMGYYARQRHENLLIAKRGDLPHPLPSDRPDSVIEAPRGRHSAKPAVVYERLERMYPHAPKIELFARSPREGWAAWGNEAAEDDDDG